MKSSAIVYGNIEATEILNMESRVEKFLKDLDNIDEIEWGLIADQTNFKVYARKHGSRDSYEVKAYTTIDNVTPDIFADFNGDYKLRKAWDPYTADVRYSEGSDHTIYWETIFPWPLWNREHVFVSKRRDFKMNGQPCFLFVNESVETDEPPARRTVRCKDFWSIVLITENNDAKNSTKTIIQLKDNAGLPIPAWLMNWAAKIGMVNAFNGLERGLRQYIAQRNIKLQINKDNQKNNNVDD